MDTLQNNLMQANILPSKKTEVLEMIKIASDFSLENSELIEMVHQYNKLLDKIAELNQDVRCFKEDVIRANKSYDEFKRNFAQIIESADWSEKLYYVLPLYEDYAENDAWIAQWRNVLGEAVQQEHCTEIRNYINRNFFSNACTLPKDVYNYKVKSKILKSVSDEVSLQTCVFASRMGTYSKLIKDFSDQLRNMLIKSVSTSLLRVNNRKLTCIDSRTKKVNLLPEEEISNDKTIIESIDLIEDKSNENLQTIESYEIKYQKYLGLIDKILKESEAFIKYARELYQDVLSFQNELSSLKKQIYTTSLSDIYKLYDSLSKSIGDWTGQKSIIDEKDAESIIHSEKMLQMLTQLCREVERYLFISYQIKPVKEIQIGEKFEKFDTLMYEVYCAEDAPSQDLALCISSISDSCFAKYIDAETIDYVTRPARISVYNNNVIKTDLSD